jgi:hypothetical protein
MSIEDLERISRKSEDLIELLSDNQEELRGLNPLMAHTQIVQLIHYLIPILREVVKVGIKIDISKEEVKGLMTCVSLVKEAMLEGNITLSPLEHDRLSKTTPEILYEKLLDIQSLLI